MSLDIVVGIIDQAVGCYTYDILIYISIVRIRARDIVLCNMRYDDDDDNNIIINTNARSMSISIFRGHDIICVLATCTDIMCLRGMSIHGYIYTFVYAYIGICLRCTTCTG